MVATDWADSRTLLTVIFSSLSLLVSICAFSFSAYHQRRQAKLTSRQTLTSTITELSEKDIAIAKLMTNAADNSAVTMRRMLNAQRRNLTNSAALLISKIGALATEADHAVVANAFETFGDFERARIHWQLAIEKSDSVIVMTGNKRDFAGFLFRQGDFEGARAIYQQALDALWDEVKRDEAEH